MISEQTLQFGCGGESLLGILARSDAPLGVGVMVVVGGPQYRAGSHRQFVLLARALAESGYTTLRFDARGMGDSTGALRAFDDTVDDLGAAIDAFCAAEPGLHSIVLWGLCDGASAALLYLHGRADRRVGGLVLVNPWVRSPVTHARTTVRHYYLDRLRDRSFWAKLFSGGVGRSAVRGLLDIVRASASQTKSAPATSFQARMAAAWAAFSGPVLLLLSDDDYTAREFEEALRSDPAWRDAVARRPPQRVDLVDADHTCTAAPAQAAVAQACLHFLAPIGAGR